MIIVASNPNRRHFQDHFMSFIPEKNRGQFCVVETMDQELGAVAWASERFNWFVLLQDSMWLTDPLEFSKKIVFHNTAYIIGRPSCYSLIYSGRVLEQMEIPMPGQDKELSIGWETGFIDAYERVAVGMGFGKDGKRPVLYPEVTDGEALAAGRYYEMFGEKRLHLRSSDGVLNKGKLTYR